GPAFERLVDGGLVEVLAGAGHRGEDDVPALGVRGVDRAEGLFDQRHVRRRRVFAVFGEGVVSVAAGRRRGCGGGGALRGRCRRLRGRRSFGRRRGLVGGGRRIGAASATGGSDDRQYQEQTQGLDPSRHVLLQGVLSLSSRWVCSVVVGISFRNDLCLRR